MSASNLISNDFDFEFGRWNVKHRRLTDRLVNSADWEIFDGTAEATPILGGNGNVEDNVLHISRLEHIGQLLCDHSTQLCFHGRSGGWTGAARMRWMCP